MSDLFAQLELLRKLILEISAFGSTILDGLYETLARSIVSILPIDKAQLDVARDAVKGLVDQAWRLYVDASKLIGLPASPIAFSFASATASRAVINMIRARLSLMNVIKIVVLVGLIVMTRSVGRDTKQSVKESISFVSQPDSVHQSINQSNNQPNLPPVSPFMSQPMHQTTPTPSPSPSPLQSQLERQLAFACSPEGVHQPINQSITQSANPSKWQLLSLLTGVSPDIATTLASSAADYWESARQLWDLIGMAMKTDDANSLLVSDSAKLMEKLSHTTQ